MTKIYPYKPVVTVLHYVPLADSVRKPWEYRGIASYTHICTCFHISKATTKCPFQTVARGCTDMF